MTLRPVPDAAVERYREAARIAEGKQLASVARWAREGLAGPYTGD